MTTMDQIASDAVLEQAYQWLCRRRRDNSPHDDVWSLRERWANVKTQLQEDLLANRYRCGVTRRVRTSEGVFEIWSAGDALVLKATAIVLQRRLQPYAGAGALPPPVRSFGRRFTPACTGHEG